MERTRIKDYSMKPFAAYLANLPRTPVTEAVTTLYESANDLRKPTPEELSEFVSMASETEHRMRGDWDSNREAIVNEDKEFIEQVSNGTFQAVTDGNGIVIYGPYDGRMYVYLLFVRPECRRTGTAQRLMDYVKSQAGGKPIALSVNNHNDAARSLYKKLGMTDSKTFGYDGYDIIEMQSPITESVEFRTFNTIGELRDDIDNAAYAIFSSAQYDEFEQEPFGSLEDVKNVPMDAFVMAMHKGGSDVKELVNRPVTADQVSDLVHSWFEYLTENDVLGWQYNWNH